MSTFRPPRQRPMDPRKNQPGYRERMTLLTNIPATTDRSEQPSPELPMVTPEIRLPEVVDLHNEAKLLEIGECLKMLESIPMTANVRLQLVNIISGLLKHIRILNRKVPDSNKKMLELTKKVQELERREVETAKKNKEAITTLTASCNASVQDVKEKADKTRNQLIDEREKLKASLRASDAKFKEVKAELDVVKREKKQISSILDDERLQRAAVQKEVELLKHQSGKLKGQLEALKCIEVENNGLKEKLARLGRSEASRNNAHFATQEAAYKKTIAELQNDINGLMRDLGMRREEHQQAMKTKEEEYQRILAAKDEEIIVINNKYCEEIAEINMKYYKTAQDSVRLYDGKIMEMKQYISLLESEIKELRDFKNLAIQEKQQMSHGAEAKKRKVSSKSGGVVNNVNNTPLQSTLARLLQTPSTSQFQAQQDMAFQQPQQSGSHHSPPSLLQQHSSGMIPQHIQQQSPHQQGLSGSTFNQKQGAPQLHPHIYQQQPMLSPSLTSQLSTGGWAPNSFMQNPLRNRTPEVITLDDSPPRLEVPRTPQ